MTPGIVYALRRQPSDGACFFIPADAPVQANGRVKGLLWDSGAAGRSKKKPVASSVDPSFWVVADKAAIPAFIPNF
jgi:hypothetical protein